MNVGRNLSYDAGGGWHKVSVSLSWRDLLDLVEEKKVEGWHVEAWLPDGGGEAYPAVVNEANEKMPVLLAYKVLQGYCDILAWAQLASEGGAAPDHAKERIRECIARTDGILKV